MTGVAASSVGMAAKLPPGKGGPAIDRQHLARMTLGEPDLEREVLTLFEKQAGMLLARMQGAAPGAIAAFAHTLKGGARSVGAWRVAGAAETLEMAAVHLNGRGIADAVEGLSSSVSEASVAIAELLHGDIKSRL
jgi:HPt (histidine-containing phosphotransfer) domain-containing protein